MSSFQITKIFEIVDFIVLFIEFNLAWGNIKIPWNITFQNRTHMITFLRLPLFLFLLFTTISSSSVAQDTCGDLSSQWQNLDIGAVDLTGETCELNGVFEVSASGADIWGTRDEFHFVYQEISADAEIVVRVNSLESTNAWAKAGIMMRNGTADNAAMILLSLSPNPNGLRLGYTLQDRPFDGASMNSAQNNIGPEPIVDYPFYLRLVREGNTFSGYGSITNGNWSLLGSKTVSMNETILLGMATTSHNNQELTTASYSEVNIESESLNQERPFITTWKTDNPGVSEDNQITIPVAEGEVYNYTVDWGDGTSDSGVTGAITHTYEMPSTPTISITGTFPRIYFDDENGSNPTDKDKILYVDQWGSNQWSSMEGAFSGCTNLDVESSDTPDLSRLTSLNRMFLKCTNLKGTEAFNFWNTTTITSMRSVFEFAEQFNAPIGFWNVSNVTDMSRMFFLTRDFNQVIGDWQVGKV